ncbi:glycine cleavage system aminomethyltransferase GcvT [bacterium]|nr:glycine cleavage system aminomethyltransferase GcvT [bacterium]
MKKTPFYDKHVAAGAKMAEFAGYYMPIRYDGDIIEHLRVRTNVGVFDVTHMGEFYVSGDGAMEFLQKMTVNDVSKLALHQAQYSAMCKPDGGIVDDLIVYRYADKFMLVVNAANLEKDFNWLKSHCPANAKLENVSDNIALLALQGPNAMNVLQQLTTVNLSNIKFYWFDEGEVDGVHMTISRTGYTGEIGYELYFDEKYGDKIWNAVMKAGEKFNIGLAGLGARDTLRLEMKYCLYGNDIDETTHPLEAGLGWITKLKKGDFNGRDVMLKAKEKGLTRLLIGLEVEGRIPARHGYDVMKDGEKVGIITSGTFSPTLQKAIAMAYVDTRFSENGTSLTVNARGRSLSAKVIPTPFYNGNPSK